MNNTKQSGGPKAAGVALAWALSFSVAQAASCPTPSTFGHGLMPMPSGLKAECGEHYKIIQDKVKAQADMTVKWYELYKGDFKAAQNAMSKVKKTMDAQGYKDIIKVEDTGITMRGYRNRKGKVIAVESLKVKNDYYVVFLSN